jgi:hypothetical protein
MELVFETTDKIGKKIRLTKKQWEHITTTHNELTNYLNQKNNGHPTLRGGVCYSPCFYESKN